MAFVVDTISISVCEKGKREWGKGKREWEWEKTSEPCIDAEPDQGHWPSIGY